MTPKQENELYESWFSLYPEIMNDIKHRDIDQLQHRLLRIYNECVMFGVPCRAAEAFLRERAWELGVTFTPPSRTRRKAG